MELSIVILTCNQKDLTLRCLTSLGDLLSRPSVEVILVDNGSSDGTVGSVSRQFPTVEIIENEVNLGVAAGRNIGLARAGGKYLLLLDNDTIASENAVDDMTRYLERHPDVGLVAPRLVSPDGTLQQSWKEFPGLGVKIRHVLSRGRRGYEAASLPESPVEPFYVIGAAQMFSRDLYVRVGPLDEKIFYGPEDADFCHRVRLAGRKVVYNPEITIIHDWQRATTRRIFSRMARRHAGALLYFYRKWRRWF